MRRPCRRRIAGSALVAMVLAGCGAGEPTEFTTATSPDGRWTLRVTVAEPRMGQGPFHVAAWLAPAAGGAAEQVVDTRLENDGVPFTGSNISLRWISASTALLCLRATDLPDRGLRIEAGPPPRAVEVGRC